MLEKKECPNCKLKIDKDAEKCPYCGTNIKEFKKDKEINIGNKEIIIEKKIRNPFPFFLFLFLGVTIIAFCLQIPAGILNPYFLYSSKGSGVLNFAVYLILLGIVLLYASDNLKGYFGKFKEKRTWLNGLKYGALVISVSILLSLVKGYLFPNVGENNNQNSVVNIVNVFPFLSLIVFGIIGPICEEFGYRVGLFGFLKKKNKVFAYIITGIIFGLIHFDFNAEDMLTELINIPDYIISGLLFCYVYDKHGVETSIVAHATNNLVSIILTIIASFL